MQLYKTALVTYCVIYSGWAFAQTQPIQSLMSEDTIVSVDIAGDDKQTTSTSVELEKNKQAKNSADSYDAEFVAVPIIFSTETLSTTIGGAGVIKHAGQAQAVALGIGLYSANDSWLSYAGFYNYQIPKLDQWLFSAELFRGHYEQGIYYLPQANTETETERIISVGDEGFSKLHIKYVLPMAGGANGAATSLARKKNAISWNPLESGVTSITLTPFNKYRELEALEYLPDEANGIELALDWDNRDSMNNSSEGGQTNLTLTLGSEVSDNPSWFMWEFEQSAFMSLGSNGWFEEQVLAANVYIADTPSWNSFDGDSQSYQRPPTFAGVSLGGFDRLRGYDSKQFTGRSAVNYALEYRMTPRWQPLQNLPVFNLYDVPWWQWALLIEAGNVSDEFSLDDLHKDMKTSYGVSVRFEVEDIVIRSDFVTGGDESQFWVMVNQPF
ncbi:outer membrane protein assembly factor [Shewanella sp. 10N.7]|uniref:outer membrane protein assembly factor n=1 Tax=Shewanella sp. 10N.7 TaxID=2885093 RepID=UPI001E5B5291|nr:outer membrane protein assembly factor [Shewanella sp. 10N.7]MCC4834084.1 outer membrane protein assembly factor [Shewanella sp. 10N.7]